MWYVTRYSVAQTFTALECLLQSSQQMTHVHRVQLSSKEIKRAWTRCTPGTRTAVLIIICGALAPVSRLSVTVHETVSTARTKEWGGGPRHRHRISMGSPGHASHRWQSFPFPSLEKKGALAGLEGRHITTVSRNLASLPSETFSRVPFTLVDGCTFQFCWPCLLLKHFFKNWIV